MCSHVLQTNLYLNPCLLKTSICGTREAFFLLQNRLSGQETRIWMLLTVNDSNHQSEILSTVNDATDRIQKKEFPTQQVKN